METQVVWRKLQRAVFSILLFGCASAALHSTSAADVTLAWRRSTDPTVVGYYLYYGTASQTYTTRIDAGNATNVTVTGLVGGTTYYFAATAYNTLGLESGYSEEISYTVPSGGNRVPTLSAISNVTINEDAAQQTVNLAGISAGTGESQPLTVTASSSNPGLIPDPTVNYSSPASTGSLNFTPAPNANGSAIITVTVNDGQASNNIFSRTFTVTVNPVNDTPTLASLSNVTIGEDAGAQTVSLSGIGSGAANENQTLTVTATSSATGLIPNPTVTYTSPGATGTLTFSPSANSNGTATITVRVNDGQAANNQVTRTFTVTVTPVNDQPTLNAIGDFAINENAGLQTVSLSGIGSGAANENQALTISATSDNPGLIPNPTINYTSPGTTGTLRFAPVAGANGTATITVTVNDGQAANNIRTRTFTVTVNEINNPPTLSSIANLTISEDAGLQTVNLSGISSGAANENQTLVVSASSSNPGLIPNPSVNYSSPDTTGSLSFTPAANSNGTATITVTVNDGQPSSNLVSRTFTVTVSPVNDQPTLNAISGITINEDAGAQTVSLSGIGSGAANENQTLTVTATSSAPGWIPNPTVSYTSPNSGGTLTLNPVANANGAATITVTVNDSQAANNTVTRTFVVTVNPVNDAPTLNPISNITLDENAGLQTVNLSGIGAGPNESQTLVVTATSGNMAVVPHPTVNYTSPNTTGSLTFTPVPSANGFATITVTVDDGQSGNNLFTRTFTVAVNAVNNPPTLNPIGDVTISEDAGAQTVNLSGITSGAANEDQPLVVTATSSVPGLIPNPSVNYTSPNTTGSLTFTPVANSNGTAVVTVRVNDGQTTSNLVTRTFSVTVNPVNDQPTLNPIANLSINQNAGQQTVNLTGISSGANNENQVLVVSAVSGNTALIPDPIITYSTPSANGSIRFTPVPGASGSANVTVTVNDGQSANNLVTRVFTVNVNALPTVSTIAAQTISTNSSTGPLAFVVSDSETSAGNLTVSASSSAQWLIPDSNIVLGGSGGSRTVTVTPLPEQSGTATITLTVSDGSAVASTSFEVTVLGPPAPPSGLTLLVSGDGIVTPNLNGKKLKTSEKYTVEAIPGKGQEFAGWTGSITSSSRKLTFKGGSNMVLVATFVKSPFILGTYSGLFYEDDEVRQPRAGYFTVTVSKHGAYSGRFQIGGKKRSFSGKFDLKCQTGKIFSDGTNSPLVLDLQLGTNELADKIMGRLNQGTWISTLRGDRNVYHSTTNPAPQAGRYTVFIPGANGDPSLPTGHGYGAVRVTSSGKLSMAGALADGTKISQSTPLSKDGVWPLFAAPYSGKGLVMGWIAFNSQADHDLAGDLKWMKPASTKARFYPAGFTNDFGAVGAYYVRPPKGWNMVNLVETTMEFQGGNLTTGITNLITMGNGKVYNWSPNALTMKLSFTTGTFTGKVKDPASGVTFPFAGAVFQRFDAAYGYMLGFNQSSTAGFNQ